VQTGQGPIGDRRQEGRTERVRRLGVDREGQHRRLIEALAATSTISRSNNDAVIIELRLLQAVPYPRSGGFAVALPPNPG